MTNNLWRQQVETLLTSLKNGGFPLANDVLIELVGKDLYEQFWHAQFDAEDDDDAFAAEMLKAGVPATLNVYLSNRVSAQREAKKLEQLRKRQAAKLALKQRHVDSIVEAAHRAFAGLSENDRGFLWPTELVTGRTPADRLPGLVPAHLVGNAFKQSPQVRAQITILEKALAAYSDHNPDPHQPR
ncbi:hypothetical protein NO932_00105 [Pelagibacterium sp. 26DY04]|uniref:hypothetical protein n=1 Tax=Pelagibacterium sp. 26DY04 TaxID=2967130 RepID=UPI002814C155|nr:hypothetical protein [Pelagibacterium sp. 26DY04]WMT87041.1 hypothetical protein NO932_00105 [Pelagibacterium sp. 26DY04]